MKEDKSGLTAINRRHIPSPTCHLMDLDLLQGSILDYGCGKCHTVNNEHAKMAGWDPNHRRVNARGKLYRTIICNYVLNVIESPQIRQGILCDIDSLLHRDGRAYITVRADIKKDHYTGKGTWQGNITLPYKLIPHKNFRMYEVKKGFSNAPTKV